MALADFRPMEERCSNCLGCKWIPFDKIKGQRFSENCPSSAYFNFNTYSARGRFELGLALLTKDAELSEQTVEAIHACTACGSCDVTCKVTRYNLEPLEHNIELKAYAVEAGKLAPGQKEIIEALSKEKTMIVGKKKADRGAWAQGLGMKDLSKDKADVMFFPGCKYSYEPKLQKTAKSAVRILKAAGVDLGYMGAMDMCCAGRALQMGSKEDFKKAAEANIKAFAAAGVKTIVTPCSDCYHAFKRQYAKLGMKVEVLHVVEYLDKLIAQKKLVLKKPVDKTVTYHDPCHLGRLGEPYVAWQGEEKKIYNQIHTWNPRRPRYNGAYGVYDAPRRVIAAVPGVALVEMDRIREYAWCCGAGGGCGDTNKEFSSWTADERVTEANATGADALVTACPWCEDILGAAKGEGGKAIEVLDIVGLVEAAL